MERFAFSCVWELTPDAEIVGVEFFKSIIKSVGLLLVVVVVVVVVVGGVIVE